MAAPFASVQTAALRKNILFSRQASCGLPAAAAPTPGAFKQERTPDE
jgi:hypothetical protein